MPIGFKRTYLAEIRERYKNARKKEKTAILDEFCRVCGYKSRKHAIRALRAKTKNNYGGRPGPKPRYLESLHALRELYGLMGGICSKKMKAAMPLWLPYYKASDRVTELLLMMSPSTIDRLLKGHRNGFNKGLTSTRPSARMQAKIPLKLLDGVVSIPGYLEGDTVAHCGSTIAGEYAHTLTATDLFSGWTECGVCWTKAAEPVQRCVKAIEAKLPFPIVGFASDNGSEFLNEVLYQYFASREAPVNFVRRRPYKKNDNAHVEQKNWTHVRELFGYQRYDDERLVPLMNEIYRAYWCPIQNLFIPSMKLMAKRRIGGRIKKLYEKPTTPAQKLLDSPYVTYADKARIKGMLSSKNPIDLKRRMDEKLKEFFQLADEIARSKRLTGT